MAYFQWLCLLQGANVSHFWCLLYKHNCKKNWQYCPYWIPIKQKNWNVQYCEYKHQVGVSRSNNHNRMLTVNIRQYLWSRRFEKPTVPLHVSDLDMYVIRMESCFKNPALSAYGKYDLSPGYLAYPLQKIPPKKRLMHFNALHIFMPLSFRVNLQVVQS